MNGSRLPRWLAVPLPHAIGWFPLTPCGAGAGILLYLLYGVGEERFDYVIRGLSIVGLAVLGLCVAVVLVAGLGLALARGRSADGPIEVLSGVANRTGFPVGPWSLFPLLSIEVAWESPRGVAAEVVRNGLRFEEEVTPFRRARSARIVRRIRVSDVFGLASVHFRRRQEREVTILPALAPGTSLSPLQQLRVGDALPHPAGKPEGDRIEMRPYAPGDPLRLVLWKIYARSGRMFVRLPELTLSPFQRTFVYFVSGDGDEPAAGVARTAIETGVFGPDLLLQADGARTPTRDAREAVLQIIGSSDAAIPAGGLGEFLARSEVPEGGSSILFVPNRPGPWLDAVTERIGGRRGALFAVLGVDRIEDDSRSPLRRWLMRSPQRGDASRVSDVQSVVERMERAGARVCVIDRTSGRRVEVRGRGQGSGTRGQDRSSHRAARILTPNP